MSCVKVENLIILLIVFVVKVCSSDVCFPNELGKTDFWMSEYDPFEIGNNMQCDKSVEYACSPNIMYNRIILGHILECD